MIAQFISDCAILLRETFFKIELQTITRSALIHSRLPGEMAG